MDTDRIEKRAEDGAVGRLAVYDKKVETTDGTRMDHR